jgi:endonuclease/exonuclease/phosphatase family metal-dependent hydrolase
MNARYWSIALLFALSAGRPVDAESLCVMTYNLRYANENPGEAWTIRRPMLSACIRSVDPDVIGTQEGLFRQLCDIASDLPEFEWIGLGRQGGSRDEFAAVFYRTARLEALEFDHFWLSDTPEMVGSMTWGNQYRRMVTWVRFRDRLTQHEFYLWNTHFDHQVQEARLKSAVLIRERVARRDPAIPVLLLGDFNADGESNPVHDVLVREDFFRDAWTTARSRRGGLRGTFNGFGTFPGLGRIDWILTRGSVVVDEVEVIEFAVGGTFPSDHFPVVARLRLNHAGR